MKLPTFFLSQKNKNNPASQGYKQVTVHLKRPIDLWAMDAQLCFMTQRYWTISELLKALLDYLGNGLVCHLCTSQIEALTVTIRVLNGTCTLAWDVSLFRQRQRPHNMMCHTSIAYLEITSCNIPPFLKRKKIIGNNVEFELGLQISEKYYSLFLYRTNSNRLRDLFNIDQCSSPVLLLVNQVAIKQIKVCWPNRINMKTSVRVVWLSVYFIYRQSLSGNRGVSLYIGV